MKLWIDDVTNGDPQTQTLRMNWTNVRYLRSGESDKKYGRSRLTVYSQRKYASEPADRFMTWDSIVVSKTPIGPRGGSTPPLDTTPPSTPTNLTATPISSSQINLFWTASTDNVGVTGYRVERCQGLDCRNFVQIGTPAGVSYNDIGLPSNTTYRYRVRATDASGNLSDYSNIASATTQSIAFDFSLSNGGNKSVVRGLSVKNTITATLVSGSSQSISFSATGHPTGSTISFNPGICSPTCSSTMTISTLTSTPTGNYAINVTGTGGDVSRTTSFTLSVVSDTTAPTTPTNLTATPVSSSQINLSWTASSDNVGVTGYRVYRCQGTTCTPTTQIGTTNINSYSDTGLGENISYRYRVRAFDEAGNLSSYSGIASATTFDVTPPNPPTNLRIVQ